MLAFHSYLHLIITELPAGCWGAGPMQYPFSHLAIPMVQREGGASLTWEPAHWRIAMLIRVAIVAAAEDTAGRLLRESRS